MTGYPDWWTPGSGGYPNVENLLKTLFTPLLSGVTPTYWLPDDEAIEATLQAGGGYLRIYRTGGKINREQKRDEPTVQFAALTQSRDESWELIEFVRQVLEAFDKESVVPATNVTLGCLGEVVGPQIYPEIFRSEKLVPVTFALLTRKPGGLPNYRQALGL